MSDNTHAALPDQGDDPDEGDDTDGRNYPHAGDDPDGRNYPDAGDEQNASDDPDAGDDGEVDGLERFERLEGTDYERVDEFLRGRVAFTAREWALARLCADFRTRTGVEMTEIGEHLPELVPFMDDPYSRQAVYGARRSFEDRVRRAGATFLYGAGSGFFTPDELDEILYEATEVATFLHEVEGAEVPHDREAEVERRLTAAMQRVHEASVELRYDRCPHCGEELGDEAE